MAYSPNSNQTEGAVYAQEEVTIIGGIRKDSTGSPSGVADGDVHPLIFNEEGRLKVSAQPAIYAATTGDITGNGQNVSVDVSRASNIMFHCTGTFATINCTFEGSIDGGSTWFTVQAVRSNANTIETSTGNLSAAPVYAWEASVNALTNFRVRSTAYTSGTQTWRFLPGAYATEPIPAIQPNAVTMAANATTTPAKARDGVAGATDTGIPALRIRRDTPTAVTAAVGNYEPAQIDSNGSQWVRLAGEIADDGAFTVGTTRVVPVGNLADETATDSVDEGDIGISRMTLDRKAIITPYAHTAGGAIPYKLNSAASTNATSVKASAGQIYSIMCTNTNAAVRYLKLYNKASAPTVGTDVPVQTYAIPGATTGAGFTLSIPVGMAFGTGIAFALTTEATDAGTTGVAANEIIVNLTYL